MQEKVRSRSAELFLPVRSDLERVEQVMRDELHDENEQIRAIATHLLHGGGKRLRPALVLLCGRLFASTASNALISVAAAVELLHMATLVHDDTVDKALLRRNVATINARWGDEIAVLMGDYLFAKAFSMLSREGDNRVVQLMADVVFRMSGGEMEQQQQLFQLELDEADYLRRIDRKTAFFIAESCRLGGILAGCDGDEEILLHKFGFGIGIGFQILDDLLDFMAGSEGQLGKPIGHDLSNGIVTLPVIHALKKADGDVQKRLRTLIKERKLGPAEMAWITEALAESGSFQYAQSVAAEHTQMAKDALAELPTGPARDSLAIVADELMERES